MNNIVVAMSEGKRSIMNLSHRMVKYFCANLNNMSSKLDSPLQSELKDGGVEISVRKSVEPGQPTGMIVNASSSLCLPLSPCAVFDFFSNEKTRHQV